MCRYGKGFSTQQALLSLMERWIIAKLDAYGFDTESLKLIKSYLTNHLQRTKVNTSLSSWSKLFLGVLQGSALGPPLFNIYINDLFYLAKMIDVCNYADDTTFHTCDLDLKNVITRLEHDAALAIGWLESNYMMLNQDKCYFLFSGHNYETLFVNVGEAKILESKQQKRLDVLIDRDLKFDEYVLSQRKKSRQKVQCTHEDN